MSASSDASSSDSEPEDESLDQESDDSSEPEDESFLDNINPESLRVLQGCVVEPGLRDAGPESRFQFEREGYFCVDRDSVDGRLVFNRTVGLRESWPREA